MGCPCGGTALPSTVIAMADDPARARSEMRVDERPPGSGTAGGPLPHHAPRRPRYLRCAGQVHVRAAQAAPRIEIRVLRTVVHACRGSVRTALALRDELIRELDQEW